MWKKRPPPGRSNGKVVIDGGLTVNKMSEVIKRKGTLNPGENPRLKKIQGNPLLATAGR